MWTLVTVLSLFSLIYVKSASLNTVISLNSNFLIETINEMEYDSGDLYFLLDKIGQDKVSVQLYYECHCPGCREFETTDFRSAVEKLGQHLDIKTYPYGNAETNVHDGKVEFRCQHGPPECYGNKLHACALDIVKNHTQALLFNSCMMDFDQEDFGSDDKAADKCGRAMAIDSKPIKNCAKGQKGSDLLRYYGEESEKANFDYVPFVLVNGKKLDTDNVPFLKYVCEQFKNPPPPCNDV